MSAPRTVVLADGEPLEIAVRRSPRARRILLSVAPVDGAVELVLPRGASVAEGLAFVREKSDWLHDRRRQAPGRIAFADGIQLPWIAGRLTIRRRPDAGRASAWREADVLHVPGRPEELGYRVERWLRKAARTEISARVADKAGQLERPYRRVSVREVRSRWGSCSARGNLNFSWRLILAPEPVLDYVVAHEVAHLAEMNHGPRFWDHVRALCADPDGARAWLRANGPSLHRYG